MKKFRVLCFFGTRPEAIKMAPVVQALQKEKRFVVTVAVSAQHRAMLDQVLNAFRLRSHVDLDLMRKGQSLFDVTSRILKSFEPVLEKTKPDLVLVHGDTTTTLGGSLAAYYKKIPVGHVEAGLRTNNKYQPFPEEINRRVTDSIATLFFAPTSQSQRNLLKENVPARQVFVTGNTVIDALLTTAQKTVPFRNKKLKNLLHRLKGEKTPFVLMTAHRRENFGRPFENVLRAVLALSKKFPGVHWVYPVHPNPNVEVPAYKYLKGRTNVHLFSPLEYTDLVQAMKQCVLVVTDSGGLQEEAPSLGKPVLVLRHVTERPEAVRAGTVRLVGTDPLKIENAVTRLLSDRRYYRKIANAVNPYGDGLASRRIVEAIGWYFGFRKKKPSSFGRGS